MRSQYYRADQKPSDAVNLTDTLKPQRDQFERLTTSQKIVSLLNTTPPNKIAKVVGVSPSHVHNIINAYMQAPIDVPNPTNAH